MELGVNQRLHRLETAISKISEVLLAKQEYPTIIHVHDGSGQLSNGRAREYREGHGDKDKDKKSVAMLHMHIPISGSSKESGKLDTSNAASTLAHDGRPRKKVFIVIGIKSGFSGRSDSVRETWMTQRKKLNQLEYNKGIVIHFMAMVQHPTTL
ncbi:hypothetical protein PTKIN_Ptkin09bG0219000 [Pterospermum kingtungense]